MMKSLRVSPPSFPSSSPLSLPRFLNYNHYFHNNFTNVNITPVSVSPPIQSYLRRRFLVSMASTTQTPSQSAAAGDDDDTSKKEVNYFQVIQAHQEKAARLPAIEEVRTVLDHSLRGTLSTFSQMINYKETERVLDWGLTIRKVNHYLDHKATKKYEGYPSGSMVDIACDAYGSPILAVSSLAVHTKDLLANPKCSLLVAKDPEDRTDLVITVHGDAVPVTGSGRDAIRAAYLARHPDAFWVDFGDFQFMRIEPKVVRFVSGVATAILGSGEFSKEKFGLAKVDPIYQFSRPIASHMNKDHADDTKLMVHYSTSVPVDFAHILDVDTLGFNVKAGYQGSTFKLRIPFSRRAVDRKDVKTLIVEMLQAARSLPEAV